LPGFDQALESVKANVLFMANLVSRNFENARAGFARRDEDFCAAVIADDEEVDLLEKQVDRAGTDVLMRFQPMVVDLRSVLATVKLGSHLERISDYAVTIARRTRQGAFAKDRAAFRENGGRDDDRSGIDQFDQPRGFLGGHLAIQRHDGARGLDYG